MVGVSAECSGFTGVVFNYVVRSEDRVDEVLDEAGRAGGTILTPAARAEVGRVRRILRRPGWLRTTASTSLRSQASAKRLTSWRSLLSPSARSVACCLWVGTPCSIALWARCSALSTETGVISSVSAVSRAEKPRTSRV